jgi:hypothetical protein
MLTDASQFPGAYAFDLQEVITVFKPVYFSSLGKDPVGQNRSDTG